MEILHMDKLQELASRAAVSHGVAEGDLNYERFGVCTADLTYTALQYAKSTLQELGLGAPISSALTMLFLAGFDIGYQARLELEAQDVATSELDLEGGVQ